MTSKMKSISGFFCSQITVLCTGLLPLLLVSCGSREEPQKEVGLGVRVLSVNQEINSDVFRQLADSYHSAHANVIVNVTSEALTLEELSSRQADWLSGADLLVFPSIANEHLRHSIDRFYPVSASDVVSARLPRILDEAYSAAQPDTLWSVPLTVDPIVMITKRAASEIVGETIPPADLSKLELIRTMQTNQKSPFPMAVFLTGTPLSLTDSIAARLLAQGFEKYNLWTESPEVPAWYNEELNAMANSVRISRSYFSENTETPLVEIPQVSDFQAFIQSPAYQTYSRLSEFQALTEEQKNLLFAFPIPSVERTATVGYVVSASVLMNSAHPEPAEQFLQYLYSQGSALASAQKTLPISDRTVTGSLSRPFPADAVFVPRENTEATPEKSVIDFFNGKIDLDTFTRAWKVGYHFPPASTVQ